MVLTWTAANNATSYNVQRAVTFGGPYTVLTNVTATSFTDTNVAIGTYYYYVVSAVNPAGQGPNSIQACATPTVSGSLPWIWLTQDIGPVGLTGSANWTNGVFTVLGGGPDIDQSAGDAFRFVYVPVTGSCTIVARVDERQYRRQFLFVCQIRHYDPREPGDERGQRIYGRLDGQWRALAIQH